MQECHYDEKMTKFMILVGLEFVSSRMSLWQKNEQGYDTGGIKFVSARSHYDEKMNKVMIPVGLGFVSVGMSLWRKNDQGYDTSGIRVCKFKNVIMMKKWPRLWY